MCVYRLLSSVEQTAQERDSNENAWLLELCCMWRKYLEDEDIGTYIQMLKLFLATPEIEWKALLASGRVPLKSGFFKFAKKLIAGTVHCEGKLFTNKPVMFLNGETLYYAHHLSCVAWMEAGLAACCLQVTQYKSAGNPCSGGVHEH